MINLFHTFFNKTNHYSFHNSWLVDAPLKQTWNALIRYEKWPVWCDALKKIEALNRFDQIRKGNRIRSAWKGTLSYDICFDAIIRQVTPYSFVSFDVAGDLDGKGFCHFSPAGDATTIDFTWNVSPTKLWMKMSSPLARPVFIENHNQIIEQSISGFTRMIEKNRL